MKMSDEMFEGKDYPTQWALNPSTYQNMNSDQVDWAALAQQWIKMKETAVPPAPPPPPIINNLQSSSLNDGGGEAPMDMDTKDDDIPPAPPAPNISGTDGWNQWNEWGNHWNHTPVGNTNWEWSGISECPDGKPIGISDTTLIPPPAPTISSNNSTFANHCTASTAIAPVPPSLPPSFGYNPIPLSQPSFNNQIPPGGFWSSDQQQHASIPGTSIPIQQPFMKGGRHNSSRGPLVSTPANILATTDIVTSRHRDVRDRTPEEELPIVLDTIKRRQLPAWIREGLEKMEREKQKAVERERQELLRKQELEARKKAEDQAREVLNPSKSKFDSDSEKEATEHELDDDNKSNNNSNGGKNIQKEIYEQNSPDIMRPRKSRFHDANSPVAHSHTPATREKSPDNTQVHAKSSLHQNKEEILQNLMLKVRRSLTEILLEVTNDEIGAVCKEVWKRSTSKASTGKNLVHASPNLAPVAQITRKLGLGIYGDSNSESEEENTSQNEHFQQQNIKEVDSDDELKETLRRRQQAFRKTEAEIEARLALEEEEQDDDDDDDEDERVKGRQAAEQENKKKNDDAWKESNSMRDDSNAKEKSRVKRDNYMGNTSCLVTGDNEKDSACDNTKKSSDGRRGSRATSSKVATADSDRLGHGLSHEDDSSSSESASRSQSSKRPARRSNSSNKNSRGKKKAAKNRSSSRSRSRSRHKYSSRENSLESSRSRSGGNRLADKKHKSHPPSQKSAGADKQYYKSGSRSSSRSESRLNSESRSRSRSRSRSKSKQKRSRTRSRSANSHRRRRSRNRRLRSRSKTRARSHSRSRSHESRSRSRSRKRSRSSYGRKNSAAAAAGRAAGKKRDTRSRSSERTRRSRSKSRSSRGYYRQHSHYRRDRDGKKSAHRYQD